MQENGIAGALWLAIQSLASFSGGIRPIIIASALFVAAISGARADVTYVYVGQQFDPEATNCTSGFLTCVSTGQVSGSVTFSIPLGFTGVLSGGEDITAFSFVATGVGAMTYYPGDPHSSPFSVLDSVVFQNGLITSASLYTKAAGQPPSYFDGPGISIGTGYGPGGDVAHTDINLSPVVWGYSDGPGTWTLASATSLISPAFKVQAERIANTSDNLLNAISFGGLVGSIVQEDGFSALLSILTANLGNETLAATADGEGAFAACEDTGAGLIPDLGPAICGWAGVVAASHLLIPAAQLIAADPFDANYQQVFVPSIESAPAGLTGVCSSPTATAAAAPLSLDQVNEWMNALYITNNRYESAVNSGDMASANLQEAAFNSYAASYNSSLLTAETDLKCFSTLLSSDNIGTQLPTQQDESMALGLLASATPDEITSLDSIFGTLGLSPADVSNLITLTEANPPSLPSETADNALSDEADNFLPTAVPEPSSIWLVISALAIFRLARLRAVRRNSPVVKCAARSTHLAMIVNHILMCNMKNNDCTRIVEMLAKNVCHYMDTGKRISWIYGLPDAHGWEPHAS